MTHEQRIPILNLQPEVEALWPELNHSIQRVLKSTHFIGGPEVEAFEQEVGRYLGTKHAVALNSGTDALVIGLKALGVGPGDEVITTAFTFFATAEAISHVGAVPVFVDIEPDYYTIDPRAIEAAITPRTKAIIPVHLYGQAAAMDEIMGLAKRHNLYVLEDVAQAFGATYKGRKLGVIGHIGAYSFFPSKNLGAYGDGGLLATDDDQMATLARMLRTHGAKKKYYNEILGYNSRLDALQAAILRVKLPHLDTWNQGRQQAARRYSELLSTTPEVITPCERRDGYHVFHQYTLRVRSERRDWLQQQLEKAGIGTMIYYPLPVHQLPIYAETHKCQLPLTEQAAREALSLPIWPQITLDTQTTVVQAIKQCFA